MLKNPIFWFSKIGIEAQKKIMQNMFDTYHSKTKHATDDKGEALLNALNKTIEDFHAEITDPKKKADGTLPPEVIKKRVLTVKKSPKTNLLNKRFKALIIRLKEEEKLSFREISKYLEEHHAIKINFSTIQKNYKKL